MVIAAEKNDVITQEGIDTIRKMLSGMHVTAIRTNADHGKMLYEGDGYVTAWMVYWLKGDQEAATVFKEGSEWKTNPLWKNVHIDTE